MNFHCPICKNLHPKERLVVVKKQSEMIVRNVITISQEGSYCVTNLGSVEKYLSEREKFANRRPPHHLDQLNRLTFKNSGQFSAENFWNECRDRSVWVENRDRRALELQSMTLNTGHQVDSRFSNYPSN